MWLCWGLLLVNWLSLPGKLIPLMLVVWMLMGLFRSGFPNHHTVSDTHPPHPSTLTPALASKHPPGPLCSTPVYSKGS